jgi:hypothetical protein
LVSIGELSPAEFHIQTAPGIILDSLALRNFVAAVTDSEGYIIGVVVAD